MKLLEKVKDVACSTKTKLTLGSAGAAGAVMSVAAFASETPTSTGAFEAPSIADSVTTASFNGILTQMTDLLPIVLPVVVACLAFRKGISFLRSMIAGA